MCRLGYHRVGIEARDGPERLKVLLKTGYGTAPNEGQATGCCVAERNSGRAILSDSGKLSDLELLRGALTALLVS